jgi:hypothetical protein
MEDWQLDNPAGRLHVLLAQLRGESPKQTIVSAWASVLQVPERAVPVQLAEVQKLVTQVRVATDDAAAQKKQVNRFAKDWQRPVFPLDVMFGDEVHRVFPSEEALDALEAVAEYLHHVRPEGLIPSQDRLDELRAAVDDLIDQVTGAALPDEVKSAITKRLHQVLEALTHIHIGGPTAVRDASEALAGVLMVHATRHWQTAPIKKLATVMSIVWFAFGAPATAQDGVAAWTALADGHLTPPALTLPAASPVAPTTTKGLSARATSKKKPPRKV